MQSSAKYAKNKCHVDAHLQVKWKACLKVFVKQTGPDRILSYANSFDKLAVSGEGERRDCSSWFGQYYGIDI